jgi:methylmalonyl-CoA/ethylmalonyl-CoA epimerase
MNFHHIGIACTDLDAEAASLASLGYTPEAHDFTDPVQGIRGRFMVGGGPRLELLVSSGDSRVLTPWLDRGVKMYHLAYEVRSLPEAMDRLIAGRARVVSDPRAAVAFGGRQIAFLALPNMQLVEIIEAAHTTPGEPLDAAATP